MKMKSIRCCDCKEELVREQEDDEDRTLRCPECMVKMEKETSLEDK